MDKYSVIWEKYRGILDRYSGICKQLQWYLGQIHWHLGQIQWYLGKIQWYFGQIQYQLGLIEWYFRQIQWYCRKNTITQSIIENKKKSRNLFKLVLVLLFASVERAGVSRMRDFLLFTLDILIVFSSSILSRNRSKIGVGSMSVAKEKDGKPCV